MSERESGTPEEYQNPKTEDAPEQAKEGSSEGIFDRIKNLIESRRQTREAYETNKDYDALFERFFDKERNLLENVLSADGGIPILRENIDKGKVNSLIKELRSLIEEIKQFEREKLGMDSYSSKLKEMISNLDEDETISEMVV
jgi:hypothetical protein